MSKKLNAKQVQEFFVRMEKYYSEEQIQKLYNIVDVINEIEEQDMKTSYLAIKSLSLRDRHTCIALAEIYDKLKAYYIIDRFTELLNEDIFEDYKKHIVDSQINEYFENFEDLDYFVLRKTIDDDGRYSEPLLSDDEAELMTNVIDYKLGIKKRILKKPSKKSSIQNQKNMIF